MEHIRNIASFVCYYIASVIYHSFLLTASALHIARNITDLLLSAVATPFEWMAYGLNRLMDRYTHD